jgi:hypothetical protein
MAPEIMKAFVDEFNAEIRRSAQDSESKRVGLRRSLSDIPIAQAIAIDAAIHHDMRDMDAERPVLARYVLRDHAKPDLMST